MVAVLDPLKIFNCSVFHNIIPFTYVDVNSLPFSYCCVGMPVSQNKLTFSAITIKDICVFNSNNTKCMLQAKILQKNLIDICTTKDKVLRNLFLNPSSEANKDNALTLTTNATATASSKLVNDSTPTPESTENT